MFLATSLCIGGRTCESVSSVTAVWEWHSRSWTRS